MDQGKDGILSIWGQHLTWRPKITIYNVNDIAKSIRITIFLVQTRFRPSATAMLIPLWLYLHMYQWSTIINKNGRKINFIQRWSGGQQLIGFFITDEFFFILTLTKFLATIAFMAKGSLGTLCTVILHQCGWSIPPPTTPPNLSIAATAYWLLHDSPAKRQTKCQLGSHSKIFIVHKVNLHALSNFKQLCTLCYSYAVHTLQMHTVFAPHCTQMSA